MRLNPVLYCYHYGIFGVCRSSFRSKWAFRGLFSYKSRNFASIKTISHLLLFLLFTFALFFRSSRLLLRFDPHSPQIPFIPSQHNPSWPKLPMHCHHPEASTTTPSQQPTTTSSVTLPIPTPQNHFQQQLTVLSFKKKHISHTRRSVQCFNVQTRAFSLWNEKKDILSKTLKKYCGRALYQHYYVWGPSRYWTIGL